jgi:hypothetical protein
MNRVELASDRSGMHMRQLGLDIRAGKSAPLCAGEHEAIVDALEAFETSCEARRNLLTLSLMNSGSHDGLLRYCKTLLERTSRSPGFTGYEAASNLALQYLLAKSPDKDYWVRQFEQSPCAILRLAVAEYVFGIDPQRALMAMIETLPLAGTDHAVTDAIDLWLANGSNPQLRAALDARLDYLVRTQPASALAAAFQHARDVVANS